MTYNFFNTSNLAFGAKLTSAFTRLNRLASAAEEALEQVFIDQEILGEYINRNYRVPRPTSLTSPCRTNEIFDLFSTQDVFIRRLHFSEGMLKAKVLLFDEATSKFTVAEGETDLAEGFAYVTPAVSNSQPTREITFSKDSNVDTTKIELFQFRVDSNNYVNLVGDVSGIRLLPLDVNQYISLGKGQTLAGKDTAFTSKDYQCVCIVGNVGDILVELNDREVLKGQGVESIRHCILYLKPDDKVSGKYSTIFRINYNQ